MHAHTHTHIHIYIILKTTMYIYIYIYMVRPSGYNSRIPEQGADCLEASEERVSDIFMNTTL